MSKVAPKDRDIAMVFQNYALYPHLNIYENLAFGLKLRKFPRKQINEKVHKAADILGIEHLLQRKPRELSGGQRQRVALGRAIVREPKVFLFDEPLSNLDAKLRVQMRTEILKLHKRIGATAIYVTHDQMEAMTMGDRIVVMKEGAILQIDEPLELYKNPINEFVAGFIGSPAMNFMELNFDNGRWKFSEVKLPQNAFNGLKGIPAKIGIRPEKLILGGEGCDVRFHAQLEVSEKMGHETLYYLNTDKLNLIVREMKERSEIHRGTEVEVGFNLTNCHFFDVTGTVIKDIK
jgi:multiple sugar transport system ATP-binding protein